MSQAYTKAQRINEIQRLLIKHQEGISQATLAEMLDVNRSTIFHDFEELEKNYGVPIYEVEHGKYSLLPEYQLVNLQFTLAESVVLYLAARRTARQSTRAFAPVVTGLDKLSDTLRQPFVDKLQKALARTQELPVFPERQ